MKTCPKCGYDKLADTARFCHKCGCDCAAVQVKRTPAAEAPEAAPLVGDKNLINESTIIGKQEKYEASNITIHNNITEDHSHTTIVCAVSGKRIYLDHSVVCPKCGTQHIGVQVLSVKDGQTQQDTQKAVSDYIPAHVECTVTFASEAE